MASASPSNKNTTTTTNDLLASSSAPMNPNGELVTAFRQKANFMKSWKPASNPSNRDRLELYAWHKQAVSGDAPASMPSMTAGERAKYSAWKQKSGTSSNSAMQNYITESERQVRVYGYSNDHNSLPASDTSNKNASNSSTAPTSSTATSRGLAAIPLLCAAASEQRAAYLRRLQNPNSAATAWWKRQEPLTAAPGSIPALPEALVLWLASTVERISLGVVHSSNNNNGNGNKIPHVIASTLQSALWPMHNCLLGVWMGVILVASLTGSVVQLMSTILLGSRRTGRTLQTVWTDEIQFAGHTVSTLCESHQPICARLVGLCLTPSAFGIDCASVIVDQHALAASVAIIAAFASTWWYWFVSVPWILTAMTCVSLFLLGNCFGLIELAGFL